VTKTGIVTSRRCHSVPGAVSLGSRNPVSSMTTLHTIQQLLAGELSLPVGTLDPARPLDELGIDAASRADWRSRGII